MIKKISLALASLAFAFVAQAATPPSWDVTDSWDIVFNYQGSSYTHDLTLTQASNGSLTGSGGYPAGGTHAYTWTLTSGSVSGNEVDFTANYTAPQDAVVPQTTLTVEGTIDEEDGSMSGTWSDNYQGMTRTGTWTTSDGEAVALGSLAAEDFGVVNYDTGLGMLKGYTAGFGLTDATFEDVESVVVKLYSGTTLLQTNTATAKVGEEITGSQISSPFDVFGDFDYETDGYWTNDRESEYGQNLVPTKVVATVTLANGMTLTAQNTNLTGDPDDIFPDNSAPVLSGIPTSDVTIPELSAYTFNANATDADGDTLTFSLTGAPSGATIDSSSGIFRWTPTEAQGAGDYTFTVVVSDGTSSDSQSVTIHVTEVSDTEEPPTDRKECKKGGWQNFTNPSFRNQGECIRYMNRHSH